MSEKAKCRICGEPLPDGEEMFNYHGYSGPCPKSPIAQAAAPPADETLPAGAPVTPDMVRMALLEGQLEIGLIRAKLAASYLNKRLATPAQPRGAQAAAPATTNVREAFEKWYAVYKDITLYIDGMQDAFEAGYSARSKERDAQAAPGPKCSHGVLMREFCQGCEDDGVPSDGAGAASHPLQDKPPADCPKCGGELSEKGGHGAWCPKETCKWGWETEMDGSPLLPPKGASSTSEYERGRRDMEKLRDEWARRAKEFMALATKGDALWERSLTYTTVVEEVDALLAATSGTPAEHNPARAPHNKFASLWCDACPRPALGTPAPLPECGCERDKCFAPISGYSCRAENEDEPMACPNCGSIECCGLNCGPAQAAAPATTPTEPELAEARLSIPAHHDDDDRLWLAAEEKRLAALVLSRDNHAWLASTTPRPDLIAISEKVWGARFDGQMVCAPTIEEAVTVLRSGLAAKDKPPAAPSEQLLAVAKAAIVGTLTNLNIRDISEIHIDAFAKEAVAQVAGQDKPPAAPLCGKRTTWNPEI